MCVCKYGYKPVIVNNATLCLVDCGNGITSLPDEECDDGNLRNKDGCDTNCKVEQNFFCVPTSPSGCTLHMKITEIKHNYAYRI